MARLEIAEAVGYKRITWYILGRLWRDADIFLMDEGEYRRGGGDAR